MAQDQIDFTEPGEDTRPATTLSVYGNAVNFPSTHVVLWTHEDPNGYPGPSAAISLTPQQALELASTLTDLANHIVAPKDDAWPLAQPSTSGARWITPLDHKEP